MPVRSTPILKKNPNGRYTYDGDEGRNGSMINPPHAKTSGYDARMPSATITYKPELCAVPPFDLKPGDSLVSSISSADKKSRVNQSRIKTQAVRLNVSSGFIVFTACGFAAFGKLCRTILGLGGAGERLANSSRSLLPPRRKRNAHYIAEASSAGRLVAISAFFTIVWARRRRRSWPQQVNQGGRSRVHALCYTSGCLAA
jgi:hypothetical protein